MEKFNSKTWSFWNDFRVSPTANITLWTMRHHIKNGQKSWRLWGDSPTFLINHYRRLWSLKSGKISTSTSIRCLFRSKHPKFQAQLTQRSDLPLWWRLLANPHAPRRPTLSCLHVLVDLWSRFQIIRAQLPIRKMAPKIRSIVLNPPLATSSVS